MGWVILIFVCGCMRRLHFWQGPSENKFTFTYRPCYKNIFTVHAMLEATNSSEILRRNFTLPRRRNM